MDSTQFVILVPIVLGITSAAKSAGFPSQFAAILSLALGVGGGFLLASSDPTSAILQGVVVGLTASGLYSGTKATFNLG